jgi:hypothetical protein
MSFLCAAMEEEVSSGRIYFQTPKGKRPQANPQTSTSSALHLAVCPSPFDNLNNKLDTSSQRFDNLSQHLDRLSQRLDKSSQSFNT